MKYNLRPTGAVRAPEIELPKGMVEIPSTFDNFKRVDNFLPHNYANCSNWLTFTQEATTSASELLLPTGAVWAPESNYQKEW
jgi:hypothetical protein